jgi:type IV pilus biogenesis protein PilP
MSSRDVASIVLAGLLAGAADAAEPSAARPDAAATPVNAPAAPEGSSWRSQDDRLRLDAPPGECLDLEGHRLANVDCAELEARLGALVRIGEVQGRIEEARAKVAEAKRKRDEIEHPRPASPVAGPSPSDPAPAVPAPPQETGRLLEIFGDQARIRWRGGDYLVRPGQRLPGGAQIVQVSLEGAVIAEGKQRTTLPFVIGTRP